ncbi:MAG: hypothetical protein ACJ72Y_08270 [Actinomycetes bacterium]
MISNVVVSYQVQPEFYDEHVALIQGIFQQLQEERPSDLEYKVVCLEDGVSFVHVSTADTDDLSNPLPKLEAFQQFAKDLGSRVATSPEPKSAQIIGSYQADGTPIGASSR